MDMIAVVVPVYKNNISSVEMISLIQLKKKLGGFPIILVAPNNLDISLYISYGIESVVRFDDNYFKDTLSYSLLCLSIDFYKSFIAYEYILVYQLDAFVFDNRLLEFCEMGYDYIGAPVPCECWGELPFHVGNGGLSLRKVSSVISVLKRKDIIMSSFISNYGEQYSNVLYGWEDCFFAYCGYRSDIDFSVPDIKTALEFSVEYNINGIYGKMYECAPFGCHRWQTNRFDVWWPLISKLGYEIDPDTYDYYINLFPWHEYKVLIKKLENEPIPEDISILLHSIIKADQINLWGYGSEGKKVKRILEKSGFKIRCIFDKTCIDEDVSYPDYSVINKVDCPIIISTTLYEKQVFEELKSMDSQNNVNCIFWTSVIREVLPHTDVISQGATLPL